MKNNLTTIQNHLNNWYILTYTNNDLFNNNILNNENSIKYDMGDIFSFNQNEAAYISQILSFNPELVNYENYSLVLIEPEVYINLVYNKNSNIEFYTFLEEMYDINTNLELESLYYTDSKISMYKIIRNIKNKIIIDNPDILDLSQIILEVNKKNNSALNPILLLEKNEFIQNTILISKILNNYIPNIKKQNEIYLLIFLNYVFIKDELVPFYTKKYNSEVYIINKIIYYVLLNIIELFNLFSIQSVNIKWELEREKFIKNIKNYIYLEYFLIISKSYYTIDDFKNTLDWENFDNFIKWIDMIVDILRSNQKEYITTLKLAELIFND